MAESGSNAQDDVTALADQNCNNEKEGREPSAEVVMQQPGEVIAPEVPEGIVEKIAQEMYGLNVTKCQQLNGYDDKNYHIHVSTTSSKNPHVPTVSPDGYVLKVINTMDTGRPAILYAQLEFMRHLRNRGIPTQEPVPSVQGDLIVFYQFPPLSDQGEARTYAVCLRSFLPGIILYDVPTLTVDLCYKVGAFLASMTKALEDFHHPFYDTFDCLWSMTNLPKVKDFVHVITDEKDLRVVGDVIEQFSSQVLSKRNSIRKGFVHGDPNEQNILIRRVQPSASRGKTVAGGSSNGAEEEEGEYELCGILDYQDVNLTYPLYDLGMTIAYLMTLPVTFDPLEIGGHVLAGYISQIPLPEVERPLVRLVVAGRLVMSLVYGVYNHSLDPTNEYLLTTGKRGWDVLHKLWAIPPEKLEEMWDNIRQQW